MNSWTEESDAAVKRAASDDETEAAAARERNDEAIFLGDTGSLPVDTRRVMVQLLLGPSVDARRQSKLWPILLRDEAVIRSRMHDLFLEVVIDHEQQVAFTRQVISEELEVPILLRRASLTFVETALLLFLRQRLTQADAQGERAVVSLADIQEHLGVFERDHNPDHAKYGRQVINAVDKSKKLSLLQRIRGSDERYEISPTLKLLFSAEEIQQLTRIYEQLARSTQATGELDDSESVDTAIEGTDDDEEEGL